VLERRDIFDGEPALQFHQALRILHTGQLLDGPQVWEAEVESRAVAV
jgi:hypothetical protein